MTENFRATTRERAIGRRLGEWRAGTALSLVEAGRKAGFSSAKLSKIENALQTVAPEDLLALALVYGVPKVERQELFREAQRAEQRRALASVTREILFDTTRDYIELEFEATLVQSFKIDLLPGFFQTAAYTAAVARRDDPLRGEVVVAQRADLWEKRKKHLYEGRPLEVRSVLNEVAIRQLVGGPKVMKDQLLHLMELSELPNVTNQIIPFRVGAYPAMSSPFSVLSFAHELHNDVVYVETVTKAQYIEYPDDLEPYKLRFADLQKLALGPSESLELIAEVVSTL